MAVAVKNPPANAGDKRDPGSTPGLGKPSEEGTATHPSILDLENPMDRGAWRAAVHRVAQSQTPLRRLSTHARTTPQSGHTVRHSRF